MTAPHPHTKPVAHPHLETTIAVVALIVGVAIETATAVSRAVSRAVAGWFTDLTDWERVHAVIRTVLLAILALVVIVLLAACRPRDTRPGPIEQDVTTNAVKVVGS